jgi:hypothetical protein
MRQARDERKWKDKDRKAKDDKKDRQNRKFGASRKESRHIGRNGRKKCRHIKQ